MRAFWPPRLSTSREICENGLSPILALDRWFIQKLSIRELRKISDALKKARRIAKKGASAIDGSPDGCINCIACSKSCPDRYKPTVSGVHDLRRIAMLTMGIPAWLS